MWKSNNQGFKEATFIQMDRREGDTEMGREARRHSVAWGGGGRMEGPHIHMWQINILGIPWERVIPDPSQTAQPRVPALGR